MNTKEVNHSERYLALSQEDKDKIEAILSFLEGKSLAEIKRLLAIASRELDVRGFLNLKQNP